MITIAIIDDDIHIGDMLTEVLTQEGYAVLRAYSGTEALYLLSQNKPDLVLLDLMLPGLAGEEVLPHIKNIPVIVLSAKVDVQDKVNLLLSGADDYMTKPFSPSELVARVKAHMARYDRLVGSQAKVNDIIEIRGIRIDKTARRVYVDDVEKAFTTKEQHLNLLLWNNSVYSGTGCCRNQRTDRTG